MALLAKNPAAGYAVIYREQAILAIAQCDPHQPFSVSPFCNTHEKLRSSSLGINRRILLTKNWSATK
jgi:hypothetical protein